MVDFDAAHLEGTVRLDQLHRRQPCQLGTQLLERVERAVGGQAAGVAAQIANGLPAAEQQFSQNSHLRLRQIAESFSHIVAKTFRPPRFGMDDRRQSNFAQAPDRLLDFVFVVIGKRVPGALLVAAGGQRFERQRIRFRNGQRLFDHRSQHAALRGGERCNGGQ